MSTRPALRCLAESSTGVAMVPEAASPGQAHGVQRFQGQPAQMQGAALAPIASRWRLSWWTCRNSWQLPCQHASTQVWKTVTGCASVRLVDGQLLAEIVVDAACLLCCSAYWQQPLAANLCNGMLQREPLQRQGPLRNRKTYSGSSSGRPRRRRRCCGRC